MPREVDKIFVGQPLDPGGGGGSNPPGPPKPSRYFGLPMMHLGKPPLPLNKPYRQPLNYPKYVKDVDPNAHVKMFEIVIRANGETNDAKILICLVLPLNILCLIGVTTTWEITQVVFLQNYSYLFVKGTKKFRMMGKLTCS
jgi:hypothetical protein